MNKINCNTVTASTCNGVRGQRRVAYLDTIQTNAVCPGNLQATTIPSCKISRGSDTSSSVLFSTGDLRYSQGCGRIHGIILELLMDLLPLVMKDPMILLLMTIVLMD